MCASERILRVTPLRIADLIESLSFGERSFVSHFGLPLKAALKIFLYLRD